MSPEDALQHSRLLNIVQQELIGNLLNRGAIIGEDDPVICVALSNDRQDLVSNLPHDGAWIELGQICPERCYGGGLHRRHDFSIEGPWHIEYVDAGEDLAHRIDKRLHQPEIVGRVKGVNESERKIRVL